VIFTAQHQPRWGQRVENGTLGKVRETSGRADSVVIYTGERSPRDIDLPRSELDKLRLSYAQHVYKAQGVTADRALVLTGGWQTDRETTYVALTRAREQTDLYSSREDLGHAGVDADAISRLADRVRESRAQAASISRQEQPSAAANERRDRDVDRSAEREQDGEQLSWFARRLLEARTGAPHGYLDREPTSEPKDSYARKSQEIRERQHQRALDRAAERDRLSPSERLDRALNERGEHSSNADENLTASERLERLLEWQAEHERDNDRGHGLEM
jgi:hypothetical protein